MPFQMQTLGLTIWYIDKKISVVNKQYKRHVVMPEYIEVQHDGFHVKVKNLIYIIAGVHKFSKNVEATSIF
jgi:hypothetical protein